MASENENQGLGLTRDERIENEKKFAPVFITGGALMLIVCSLVNLAFLKDLNAFFSTVPFAGFLALYTYLQYRGD